MVRIDGKLRTVQRAAWEFANGPVGEGMRVNSCTADRACVRVEHLSLSPTRARPAAAPRRARRRGGLREVRPNTWELSVSDGTDATGRPRRRFQTIHGTRRQAEQALADLVAATRRDSLGDLRVRELVDRYLEDHGSPIHLPADDPDTRLARDIIGPHLGELLAALAITEDIRDALETAIAHGIPAPDGRDAVRLLRRSYQWAARRGWHTDDPTADIDTRWLGR